MRKFIYSSRPSTTYRNLTEGSVDAVLVAGNQEIDAGVILLRLFDREPDVVVEDLFNRAACVGDFSGAFKPLNCATREKKMKKKKRKVNEISAVVEVASSSSYSSVSALLEL